MQHQYSEVEERLLNWVRDSFVDLGSDATKQGRAIRDSIIAQIEDISGQGGFPILLIGESFGAGSFGRRTLCKPLDDIDIYIVMNAGGATVSDDGTTYTLEGKTPGPLTNESVLREGFWISADLVLQRVAYRVGRLPTVQEKGSGSGINNKRKSAFIKFGDLNIDITPVVCARFSNAIDRYYMPVGRGSTFWKPTNPKEDQRRLSAQNQAQRELLLPIVRMLKWWNQTVNQGRIKGIHLEVMVERALAGYYLEGIAQGLHLAFASIPGQLQNTCPDPTGLGPALDVNLSPEDRSNSSQLASAAHLQAIKAANCLSKGSDVGALYAWRDVFKWPE